MITEDLKIMRCEKSQVPRKFLDMNKVQILILLKAILEIKLEELTNCMLNKHTLQGTHIQKRCMIKFIQHHQKAVKKEELAM